MHSKKWFAVSLAIILSLGVVAHSFASDWPTWRHDANRTGASPHALPADLHLQWVLQLPQLEPAWPDEPRMTFDHAYAPVVAGKTMFVGSSRDDSIRAYDTETASEKWRFYADGPIRLAPAAWNGKVYLVSDDGWLYCLDAADGRLVWKFRGAPSDRKVLGNKRLVSTWLARGGPVLADGKVYFGAGIWPFMGVFIYALDAETGQVVWVNDGSGSIYMNQPHSGAVSFAGVAPQGYFVAAGDKLLIPNGRAAAAAFERDSGRFLYFHHRENAKSSTAHVAAIGQFFNNGNRLFRLSDGKRVDNLRDGAILTENTLYATGDDCIEALAADGLTLRWQYAGEDIQVHCKAGNRLYASRANRVLAIEDMGSTAVLGWGKTIVGNPASMIAADDKLVVATNEGSIYCFGDQGTAGAFPRGGGSHIAWPPRDEWITKAQAILAETGVREGYCLVLGVGTGRLMEELARGSDLRIIGLDPDAAKFETLRRRWDGMGLPRERLCVLEGDICSTELPPYLASLIVLEDLVAVGIGNGNAFVEAMFNSLRPYGGLACFPSEAWDLLRRGAADNLPNARVRLSGDFALLERAGALPGSADWTHQYADAANTAISKDEQVKAPLGLLWFGGSSNGPILPRHGHGPAEQVVGGRLFIEGPDIMRAMDVYTGRVLWEADLPSVGANYDYTSHEAGANSVGSNYASAHDGVYVAYGTSCLRLDPATGEILSTFTLPGKPICSQVKIWDDLLIVAADPRLFDPHKVGIRESWNATSSKNLAAVNRYNGAIVWQQTADNAFHHNTIIVGNDILFCIDRLPPGYEARLSRRGITPGRAGAPYELLALNVRTGKEIWSTAVDIFGTWLGYSEAHDILLQSGRASRDMIPSEPTGRLITYRGRDGTPLWQKTTGVENGPYLLHGDTLFMQDVATGSALDLRTGARHMRTHPMTGESVPWRFLRAHGCNTAVGSQYLLTFRSGAAGYFDLRNNGGTGNLGGFRSGCTSNLFAANGVLNAPDYTRTCTCCYQNQTSLALIHMPEAEMWTCGAAEAPNGPIKRVGINFGAPGDRLSDDGTLWLDYPSVGGPSPDIGVQTVPEKPEWFRRHSSRFAGDRMGWVTASGAIGLTNLMIELGNSEDRAYRVRLHFAEPEGAGVGQRLFDVALQGKQVLKDFDIARHAGPDGAGVAREFRGIMVQNALRLTLAPSLGSPINQPVICGIEVVAE